MEQLGSHQMGFHGIWYLSVFFKSVEEIAKFFKIYQELLVLYTKTATNFCSYLAQFFLE